MNNTLKQAAQVLREDIEDLMPIKGMCGVMDRIKELASIAAELDYMAQVEPVAFVCDHEYEDGYLVREYNGINEFAHGGIGDPLYYAPQPQEPVNQQLLAALKEMVRAYNGLLESGRNKIIGLGGECDDVELMSSNSADVRNARKAIAAAEAAQKGGA